jgi:hypothetical protein
VDENQHGLRKAGEVVIAEDYVRMVSFELRDLPWRMRRNLVWELRAHLDELPPGTDLKARLGTPEKYAADLRSAAGLERRRGLIAFLRARRPRNLILTAVLLTVIGLAIGAVVWIDSYQPITFGDGYQFPAGAKGLPGVNGESVVFHKDRPFQLGVNVFNNGRFAVRILGVPYASWLPFSGSVRMSKPAKYDGGVHLPFTPFHPFELKPGDSAYLILKGVYTCRAGTGPGTSVGGLDEFPVRFRFLWRTTTAYVPFGDELAFAFPKGCTPAGGASTTP